MEEIKTKLTNKQTEIIQLIYRFRFLDRIHIQTLLNHKDKSRVNKWLAELAKAKYVGCDYEKTLGKNRNPSVYYLDKLGIKFIRETFGVDNRYLGKLYREEIISRITKNHSLKTATFYLILKQFANERNAILEYYTKADLAQNQFFEKIKPDGYFTFETEKGKRSAFIEIDLGTESMAQIRRKLQKYISYRDTKTWQRHTKEFPGIVTISVNQQRLESMLYETEVFFKHAKSDPLLCKFTTFEHIEKFGLQENIWSVALGKSKAKLI